MVSIATQNMRNKKGLVWGFKNNEFNIFKPRKDDHQFLEKEDFESVQKCRRHQPNIVEVREAIAKIKQ